MPWSDERPWTQASLRIWSRGFESRVIWSLRSRLDIIGSEGVKFGESMSECVHASFRVELFFDPWQLERTSKWQQPLRLVYAPALCRNFMNPDDEPRD